MEKNNTNIHAQPTHPFEWLALALLVFCFFITPISVTLTTIFYLLAFLFTLLFLLLSNTWQERWNALKHNHAVLSFWVLFLLFLIGIIYTTSTWHLAWHDLQKRHWMLITPFFMMMITDTRWRNYMLNAFLLAMVITLLLSYLKWFHVSDFRILHTTPIHGAGVFNYHIAQNFAMSIAAFVFAHRALFEKNRRFMNWSLFILMAINIVLMSKGRTGYVIFFLLVMYLAWIRFGWKGFITACIASILFIDTAFFISNNFHERMQAAFMNYQHYHQTMQSNDIAERLQMWDVAKKMIGARPWFGYGTGGIQTAMQKMIPENEHTFIPKINYVESIYLNFLLEFGVFGFVVLIVMLAIQIRATFQLPPNERHLMQAVLIAVLFGGLFNSFFVSFTVVHLYALFSALFFSALAKPATHLSSSFKQLMN